jgi:hypothetical protein
VSGCSLPLAFELRSFGYLLREQREVMQKIWANMQRTNPTSDKDLPETFLIASYHGRAMNLSMQDTRIQLPEPGGALSVTDYRLSSKQDGIDHVSYNSEKWHQNVDAELIGLLEAKKQSFSKKDTYADIAPRSLRVTATRGLVILVFLAPIMLLWGARIMRKSKQSNKTAKQ